MKPRVLVVEDNVVNRKVVVRMLERLGYLPNVAVNGLEALSAIRPDYNYIRQLASLSVKRPPRTPAMAAEIFDRRLSFRTIMSWVARPRGRPPCAIRPNGRP